MPDIAVTVLPEAEVAVTVSPAPEIAVTILPPPVVAVKVISTPSIVVVTQVPEGGSGETTEEADAVRLSMVASAAIGGDRVVRPTLLGQVSYASSDVPEDMIGPFWLTMAAAEEGVEVQVLALGTHVESSWDWTPNLPVYLGINGLLTQEIPSAPSFLAQVGTALSSSSIYFDPRLVLVLA